MRYILFVSAVTVAACTYASAQVREPTLENGLIEDLKAVTKVYVGTSNTLSQEPELPMEEGKIEDLKGVTKVYVGAPDHYSSLFLREIVETVRKKIPRLVFVWDREDADVWLLFSVESNLRDASVRGRIIRSLGPGRLRLVKQYSGHGNKGAEGFAEEFVKSYRRANPGPEADVALVQQATSLPPRLKGESLKGESGSVA